MNISALHIRVDKGSNTGHETARSNWRF